MRFVVQIEIDHRVLYGPFDTIDEAVAVAKRFQDEHKPGVLDIPMFTHVKQLHDTLFNNPPIINPDRTTIQDHIDDIGDAMT